MLAKIVEELATGWIWAVLPLIAVWAYRQWRRKFRKRYAKFTLYRVIRLRFQSKGEPAYYTRRHHTFDEQIPVFDETWILNGVQCNYRTHFKPLPISSFGVVDAYQILPEVRRSTDSHPHRKKDLTSFEFTNRELSDGLAATGVLVNGLQEQKSRWFATTAQYTGQSLTLVVDFSSLPDAMNLLSNITGVLRKPGSKGPDDELKEPIAVHQIGGDVFSIVHRNAREGEVIMLRFRLDEDHPRESVTWPANTPARAHGAAPALSRGALDGRRHLRKPQ